MMGERLGRQERLLYEFCLDDRVIRAIAHLGGLHRSFVRIQFSVLTAMNE